MAPFSGWWRQAPSWGVSIPGTARPATVGLWWVLTSALVWGLVAVASLSGEGHRRAGALPVAFPVAVLFSLVGGAAAVLSALARHQRASR